MAFNMSHTLPSKGVSGRIVAAFVAVASIALITTAGAVSALNGSGPTDPSTGPATKEACKNDGWKKTGWNFKNQGDCVSWFNAQHGPGNGGGYGGNNGNTQHVDLDLDLEINGDGNVINIIINFLTGRS